MKSRQVGSERLRALRGRVPRQGSGAESVPDAGPAGRRLAAVSRLRAADPLSGRHLLLVSGRSAEGTGPGVNALATHLESVAGRVTVLPHRGAIPDLLGRRVVGRPDLVIAILPGRTSSLAAVRVAERLGAPLLVVVNSVAPASWGEMTTLRRATRVAVTEPRRRERVTAAGVAADRVEVWHSLLPSALPAFDGIMLRTLSAADRWPLGKAL